MKKVLIAGFLAALVFGGCNLFPNLSFEDIEGEWDFPDTAFNSETATAIHLSLMSPALGNTAYRVDLGYTAGGKDYFCWGDGDVDGDTFTGTYSYNVTDSNTYAAIDSGSDTTITVNFTLSGNKLKAVFTGSGPLNGLTIEQGTQST